MMSQRKNNNDIKRMIMRFNNRKGVFLTSVDKVSSEKSFLRIDCMVRDKERKKKNDRKKESMSMMREKEREKRKTTERKSRCHWREFHCTFRGYSRKGRISSPETDLLRMENTEG